MFEQCNRIIMANRTFSSPADTSRKSFSDDEIQKVWNKDKKIEGEDARSGVR